MLCCLIAWDSAGDVIATLDHLVVHDENGEVLGLADFEAHELAGHRLQDFWSRSKAVGSGTWPEWINPTAFTVELEPNPSPARARIKALVHKKSGHRRERAAIEAEVASRIEAAKGKAKKQGDELRRDLKRRKVPAEMVALVQDPEPEPVDLRDLLGGPNRPLLLDDEGRNRPRAAKSPRPALPVVRKAQGRPSEPLGG